MIEKGKRFTVRVLNKAIRIIEGKDHITKHKSSDAGMVSEKESIFKNSNFEPKTVHDLKSEYCSGCSACASICPMNALEMGRDSEGYLIPILDIDKCMNCGKCVKVCPVINTKKDNSLDPTCYAVMANDEIRMKSSSGGVFSLLAKYVLERGGYVCGVTLDESFNAKHIIVDSEEELEKLRGSKYVQADTNGVFAKIKELLDKDQKVLFSGCPCQVAGLKGFLQKQYDNLITIDLVCHGGPSQMVFDQIYI